MKPRACSCCRLTKPREEFPAAGWTCLRCKRSQYLRITYRIDIEDFEVAYAAQDGVCFACKKGMGGHGDARVNFDFTTRQIKGLTCKKCCVSSRVKGAGVARKSRVRAAVEAGVSHGEIAQSEGVTMMTVRRLARPQDAEERRKQKYDLTGVDFGGLHILGRDHNRSKKRSVWLCQCRCGKVVRRPRLYLTSGYATSCGCEPTTVPKPGPVSPKRSPILVGEITESTWSYIGTGAAHRGLVFDITPEYAWQLFVEQEGRCVFTGEALSLPPTSSARSRGEWTASLDRIDSKRGYVEGNVQWIHKKLQKMKWAMSDAEFRGWCSKVTRHHRATQKSRRRTETECLGQTSPMAA